MKTLILAATLTCTVFTPAIAAERPFDCVVGYNMLSNSFLPIQDVVLRISTTGDASHKANLIADYWDAYNGLKEITVEYYTSCKPKPYMIDMIKNQWRMINRFTEVYHIPDPDHGYTKTWEH